MMQKKSYPIFVIGLCYGNSNGFERRLKHLFDGINISPILIIVDNHPSSSCLKDKNTNFAYEFSGYLEGLSALIANTNGCTTYNLLVINDTIFSSHLKFSVVHYIRAILKTFDSSYAEFFSGVTTAFPPSMSEALDEKVYISTFAFGLRVSRQTLLKLDKFFARPLSISALRPFLKLSKSSIFNSLVDNWLLFPGFLSGWHGSSPLSIISQETFYRKKVAIACEFLLPYYLKLFGMKHMPFVNPAMFTIYSRLDRFYGNAIKLRKRYLSFV